MAGKSDLEKLRNKVRGIADSLEILSGKIDDTMLLVNDLSIEEGYTDDEEYNIDLISDWLDEATYRVDNLVSDFYDKNKDKRR
jgi:hypothetical protein